MIDNLWAGWRNRYLSSLLSDTGTVSSEGSVFTRILESGLSDDDTYIVYRGTRVFVILNAYPYCTGHLMVLPYREVRNLDDLDPDETGELWSMVTVACRAIRAEYSASGMNVGINMGSASGGSIDEHLHVHVVPRWVGDSNFLATTANTKAMPEALDITATRLRRAILATLEAS
ncbi:MAG: HIT family protein [Ilumatobacteraceae bacterium]